VTEPESWQPRSNGAAVSVDDAALHLIDLALDEDRGAGDWTSRWIIPARTRVHAHIRAKASGVVAGVVLAEAVMLRLDPRIEFEIITDDGGSVESGSILCVLRGPGRAVLTGERTALNFLQRLSGIATLTRRFVDAVQGTGVRILDTRKTTPGWRTIEKAAVRAGGGENHRAGLYDAILVKENHAWIAGGLQEAIRRIRDQNTHELPVIVEVRDAAEVAIAVEAGVDRLLLDNMSLAAMRETVRGLEGHDPRPKLEASGNVRLENVRAVAETGIDFISIGALTHSAPALDLSLLIGRQ
jgi:nicotinate-nucleotide pyrophosphorylase (carboxylating)